MTLTEFDDEGDGTYTRAETYKYGGGDLVVRTAWYDEWAVEVDGANKALAEQTIDRILTVTDSNSDGTGESRKFDVYDAAGVKIIRSLFDDDNAADGSWERAEGFEHDAEGRLVLAKAGDAVAGTDAETATVVWNRAEIHVLDGVDATSETRFFDDYDGTSDFATLEDETPDRIHRFGVELDGDGSDDARHEKLDADGRTIGVLFDIDSDGVDRAEAHDYDEAGRRTQTRFHDTWTGTFDLSGEAANKIHSWTYSAADTTDTRWLTFSEDLDGDGKIDRKTAVAYHGTGDVLATRLREHDDGSDGETADDGTVDRRVREIFDAAGALTATEFDDDGDETFERTVDADGGRREHYDGEGRIELAEFDDDNDGVYDRAVAWEYGAENLKTRTVWYDGWADGTDLAGQTIDRELAVADPGGSGTGDSRRHKTYNDGGDLVVRALFDTDNAADGSWERAEIFGYDASGRMILHKTGDDVFGTDAETATVVWNRAEVHIRDGDGVKTETRFFDDYDGTSDFAALSAAAADQIHRFGTDHDGDGTADIQRDVLDDKGRVALSVFENGADGADRWAVAHEYSAGHLKTKTSWYDEWTVGTALADQTVDRVLTVADDNSDGTGDSRRHKTYNDGGDLVVRALFDTDNAADGSWERAEIFGYDAAGRLILHKTGDDVSGTDAETATVVWNRAEIHVLDGVGATSETRFFDDYDGTSDFATLEDETPDRIHRFGVELDGDGSDDARHEKLDADGRTIGVLFDIDSDGVDRAEAHDYDEAGRRTQTRFHDTWTGTFDLSGEAANKIHSWTYSAADMTDTRWLTFSEDLDGDGKIDRKTAVAYHGTGDVLATRLREHDDGSDGETADDGTVDRRVREIFDAAGALTATEFDDDGDETFERTVDADGGRREHYDGEGRIELAEFDDDNDGVYDRAVAWEYGAENLKTRTVWYDGWADGTALADQTIDRELTVADPGGSGSGDSRRHKTYNDGGDLVVRSLFDTDNAADGSWERAEIFGYDAAGRLILHKTGDDVAGTDAETATVVWNRAEVHIRDGDGVKTETRFFDAGNNPGNYDGTSEFADLTAEGNLADRIHYFGADRNGDGTADIRRDMLDDAGQVVLSVFEDGVDGIFWAVSFEYGAGHLKTKTSWYDEWTAGTALAGQTVDRVLKVADGNGDGTGDSRQHDTYDDDANIVRSLFDDNAADGSWERAEGFEYDAAGQRVLAKTGDAVTGTDPDTAAVVWSRAEIHILDGAGATAETRFFDDYDGSSDFATLENETPDRIHRFGVELDSDGDDDARHEKLNADGKIVEVLFDIDSDGVDRAEAHSYDEAGRRTQTRFHDTWTGTFDLSGEAANKIHSWTYSAADMTDTRWLTFSEDLDGDGKIDRKTAVAYHGTGDILATRLREHDDGSDGGTADDGTVDRRVRETFDTASALTAAEFDDDGDGTFERTVDAEGGRRERYDGEGRIELAEFDDDNDGVYDRAVAWEYGAEDLKTRTIWYDEWADGTALADQTIDRELTVADPGGNGTGDSRRHKTYNDGGDLVIRALFDTDNAADGSWERAEIFGYDAAGRLILHKTGDDVSGTDAETATVVWSRAEIHILDGAGATAETRFFDDYDGSSVFATLENETPDRIHRFGVELDSDGDDDARHEKLNADGKIVEVLFDIDSDGVDRAEAHSYDEAGRRTQTRFHDTWAGTFDLSGEAANKIHSWTYSAADTTDTRWLTFSEDLDGDGKIDRKTAVAYHGTGDILATRLREHDDGSDGGTADDGTVDRRVRETFDTASALTATEFDDDGDETFERTVDDDGGRRERYDGEGRVELAEFDDDNDGVYDRAVAWEYGAEDLKTRTIWYDEWADGTALADQTIDRELTVADPGGNGTGDSRRHKTYNDGGDLVIRALFDTDNAADGGWERAEIFGYDAAGRLILHKTGDDVAGTDAETATVVWSRAEIHILDGAGATAETRFFDDYDGTSDFATLSNDFPGRVYRYGLELDSDGNDDARYDKVKADGQVVESLLDIDSDGVDRAEAHNYDDAGRKTETRYYDPYTGTFDLSDETADKIHRWTYNPSLGRTNDFRWLEFTKDDNNNNAPEYRVTVTYHGAGDTDDIIATKVTEHDDGSGGGANDDGDIDRRTRETFDAAGALTATEYDDDGDGVYERTVDAAGGRRERYDDKGRVALAEFDEDGDGTYTRGVAYEYGSDDIKGNPLVTRTAWYDEDWVVVPGANGAALPLAVQTVDRELTVTDDTGLDGTPDGIGESRRHDTYDNSKLIIRSLFDTDNAVDGSWERAEAFGYDAAGRLILRKASETVAGSDPVTVKVTYDEAEIHILDGAGGISEIRLFEGYDGTSDFTELTAEIADRVYRYGLNLDDNGSADDARYDKLDASGRVVESLFDIDANKIVESAERHYYDGYGRKTATNFFDPYTGTFDLSGEIASKRHTWSFNSDGRPGQFFEDFDADGTHDVISTYTYHGTTDTIKTRRKEYDIWVFNAGDADDGTIDKRTHETFDSTGGLIAIKYDDDGNGTWERTVDDAGGRRAQYDSRGRVTLIEFDDSGDESYTRAVTYWYVNNRRDLPPTKTTWYDDWMFNVDGTAFPQSDQTIDRVLTLIDADSNGFYESRKHDTYNSDGLLIIASLFDDDNAPDGNWERAEGYEYAENTDDLILKKTGDTITGTVTTTVIWNKAEIYLLNDDGGTAEIRFFDNYDGTSDFAALAADTADRSYYYGLNLDDDFIKDDARYDKLDANGWVVESLTDIDTDKTVESAEGYGYDTAGRRTETRFYDPYTGTFDLSDATPRNIYGWTYDSDITDARRLTFSEDFDGDGTVDLRSIYTYYGTSDTLKTKQRDYDDGTGAGAPDDGMTDKRVHETFNGSGSLIATKHDSDGDGNWDRRVSVDDRGRVVLIESNKDNAAGFEQAEGYVWNATGTAKIRTDFYDDWNENKDAADQQANRSVHIRQDYDGDKRADDSKTETWNSIGEFIRIEYDYESNGVVEHDYRYIWTGGTITSLDASGSIKAVNLGSEISTLTGMLTVTTTKHGDTVENPTVAGGSKAIGTLNTGHSYYLGDGADTFNVRDTANTEDADDDQGMQTASAPRLTINAGKGDDTIIAKVDALGAITVDGGAGADTFKFINGFGRNTGTLSGHFIRFNAGEGDDTLLVEADADGASLRPVARIANVENIKLALGDSSSNGGLAMRLVVTDGFSDAVKVISLSTASLTADDLDITFALEPGVDGGLVDVGGIDASGIHESVRPRINVEGGAGDDVLAGGDGPTAFRFREAYDSIGGDDTVRGYSAADGDVIVISGAGVKDDWTTVSADGNDTVIAYTLVDDAGTETKHKITVEGVSVGVQVLSETAGGLAGVGETWTPPKSPGGRAVKANFDGKGRVYSEGFDDDGDTTLDRFEFYVRDTDGFISRRRIEFDEEGDGTFERRREDIYDRGVLTEVRHDLDADGVWDHIDTYTYPRWDTRPIFIRRTETRDNTDDSDDRSNTYHQYYYHGSDGGDGRIGGLSDHDEWILGGPGRNRLWGGEGRDWFIVDEGDNDNTIYFFNPVAHQDRIWVREDGVDFDDLKFSDSSWLFGPGGSFRVVTIWWDGEPRLYLAGGGRSTLLNADFASDKGYILFGEDLVVVPDAVGRDEVRDGSGRVTEVRYFDGWDGIAGFDSLDPDRVQKYAYEGTETDWMTSAINGNPFDDGVFETKVSVDRYGNGAPASRDFDFDDGSNGGTADDGIVDRRRRDLFDLDGRIAEIRHDIDADGTWDHIDTITYDAVDQTDSRALLPRARSVVQVNTKNTDSAADDETAEAVRLVFGTDGNDREDAAIRGVSGTNEWFIPGPGDDIVAIDTWDHDPDDDDVFILEYGDGRDLLGLHPGQGAKVADRLWIREADPFGNNLPDGDHESLGRDIYYSEFEFPPEIFSGRYTSWFYSDAMDRIMIYRDNNPAASFWSSRFAAPDTVPLDPDSFIYGSRNAAWTLDDAGRVTEIRFFDAWDGIGDPSVMKLAPDRVHRYTYDGDKTYWKTFSKNDNALEDSVFEYTSTVVERWRDRITKETILFDDGRGSSPGKRTAGDGIDDRLQENTYDASTNPPKISTSKYDHDNDGTWDVEDAYVWDAAVADGPNKVTRTVDGTADRPVTFIYGGDGDDAKEGTGNADWIDTGKGSDVLTGGGGADVFIFRYGDGTDVIKDFELKSDTIWIREDGFDRFDPTHVGATVITLGINGDPAHPYIPASLHPVSGTTKLTVLTYGGGEDDRLIIVGGTEDADVYRAHFAAHDGHIPDFGSRDTKDAWGRVVLTEFDDDKDRAYERAEAYIWTAAGKIRTDFYDDWDDSHGTADLAKLDVDRSAHFMQNYDGDGSADDSKTETFDSAGRVTRVAFDYNSDGNVNKIGTYTWSSDNTDIRWLTFSEDFDADGTNDRKTAVTYHGITDAIATRITEHDNGQFSRIVDDGNMDLRTRETFDRIGIPISTEYDDDLDGTFERTVSHRSVGQSHDKNGSLVSEGFDDNGDATLDRFEFYFRDASGFINKRVVNFGDNVRDGSPDRRREDIYEKGVLTAVRHDLDADGTMDIIDSYAYQTWDTRPRSIRRVVDSDEDGVLEGTTDFDLYSYYGGDGGDGRVGGRGDAFDDGAAEWLLAGPGDDVVRGHGKADWFIVDADDGEDTIVDFRPTTEGDRIWIREDGIDFNDLSFSTDTRDVHYDEHGSTNGDGTEDDTVDGVVVSWGGEDRLWLPGRSKAGLAIDKGFFLFSDEVVVPDAVGREYVKDSSGRTTEAWYFDGWDGNAGFGSLNPDRVHQYAYAGDSEVWNTVSINDDPFDDDIFETKVSVVRYGNGTPVSRKFEFDDVSIIANKYIKYVDGYKIWERTVDRDDGVVDRIRIDFFDREGRIAEIRHDTDADGTWDHIDVITYDTADRTDTRSLLPRARSVERVSTMDDDDDANNATADAVRLVFGTDGHDRRNAAIKGIQAEDEWFIPGRGDDIVNYDKATSAGGKDVYILEYGDGQDLLGPHASGSNVVDRIWIRDAAFDAAAKGEVLQGAGAVNLAAGDLNSWPGLQFPEEGFGRDIVFFEYGDEASDGDPGHDRIIIYDHDSPGSIWNSRFAEPETVPLDPDSFIYGSRNAAWTLDDLGRVTEIRFFDAWDGIGDPSIMNLAPDRVHRYTYNGDGTYWQSLSKNDNALGDSVFEYTVIVERNANGKITKETIRFDDGLGSGSGGRTANDGTIDRMQVNAFDASASPPRLLSSKYDNDNDGAWDVEDAYAWDAAAAGGPDTVTRKVGAGSAAAGPAVTFIYGTGGNDTTEGTVAADWIDAGVGDDVLTGGGGPDVFIFRYGDGADIIQDFEAKSDTIWIKEDGFDLAHVEATLVDLGTNGDPDHPYIPDTLHPVSGTTKVVVLTYGGGEDDRLIIVGGTDDIDAYRSHFAEHAGHVPDFGGG